MVAANTQKRSRCLGNEAKPLRIILVQLDELFVDNTTQQIKHSTLFAVVRAFAQGAV
jgi:hypothetical protein